MAIATQQSTGAPFAKLVELGDTLVGAFASDPGKCRRQARNFETKAPATKPDGSPLYEEVMHFIAMPGCTAQLGDAERGYQPIEPGTHVRFTVQGFKWGQVIQARKNLPAANGFGAGVACSGDVYKISLAGWSAETKNPQAAQAAGFTVVEGRIVLRTQEEKDQYVLHQSRSGGNTNPARDLTMTVRRPLPDEKRWEQAADELYLSKPWEGTPSTDSSGADDIPVEPF